MPTQCSRVLAGCMILMFSKPLVNAFITQVSEILTTTSLFNQVLLAARLCKKKKKKKKAFI